MTCSYMDGHLWAAHNQKYLIFFVISDIGGIGRICMAVLYQLYEEVYTEGKLSVLKLGQKF